MKKIVGIVAVLTMMSGLLVITGCNCATKCEKQENAAPAVEETAVSCDKETKCDKDAKLAEGLEKLSAACAESEAKTAAEPAAPAAEAATVVEKAAEAAVEPAPVEVAPEAAASGCPLFGKWVTVKLAGAEKVLKLDREPAIDFRDESRISGYTGINTIGGQFTVSKDDSKIKFDKMISTMKAGPEENMAFEKLFNTALNNTASFKIEAGKLYFYDAEGKELMVLQK